LHRFLENVEMENQGIRADHFHGPSTLINAVTVIELNGA
jgi:hypothetical protein